MTISLVNAEIILPDSIIEKGSILINENLIEEISRENKHFAADKVFDLVNLTVFPGFIDIHNHGAIGVDVNAGSVEDFLRLAKFLAQNGVTAWLPTLVPDADENYAKIIGNIEELMHRQENKAIAQALGVHYEGVFANEKMCGALHTEYFKTFADGDEFTDLPKINDEQAVHFMTLAPEIENGIELIRELKKQDWTVSIGHTKSDTKTLDAAFDAGARHLTHFFNAMTGLHHRDVGVVGWGLTNDEVSFDIIADGVHVHPKMLEFACRSKQPDKVILISDSVAPTGLGNGEFELWNEKISVVGGKTRNENGSIAGSVITIADAVKLMFSFGFSPMQISQMASTNPARLLGLEKMLGSVKSGNFADLVVLDKRGIVKLCFVKGKSCQEISK